VGVAEVLRLVGEVVEVVAVVGDELVELAPLPAIRPAEVLPLGAEPLEAGGGVLELLAKRGALVVLAWGGWRVGGQALAELFLGGGERAVDDFGQAFAGELLGAAVSEEPAQAGGQRVRFGGVVAIEGEIAAGQVEAGFVAVAREGGVAPLAVELVGAEDEGAVDGGTLGAVGGDRVAVVEVAAAEVDRVDCDRAPTVVDGDGLGSESIAVIVPRRPLTTSRRRSLRVAITLSPVA
jgi:hypothetical protein